MKQNGWKVPCTENNGSLMVTKKFFHSETHYISAQTGLSTGVFLACVDGVFTSTSMATTKMM